MEYLLLISPWLTGADPAYTQIYSRKNPATVSTSRALPVMDPQIRIVLGANKTSHFPFDSPGRMPAPGEHSTALRRSGRRSVQLPPQCSEAAALQLRTCVLLCNTIAASAYRLRVRKLRGSPLERRSTGLAAALHAGFLPEKRTYSR